MTEAEMTQIDLQDVRRDALELLRTEISVHILDIALEDIPDEEDLKMLSDSGDDEMWSGIFTNDNDSEKMYEVTYNYNTDQFYITTFLMTYCNKYAPPHQY